MRFLIVGLLLSSVAFAASPQSRAKTAANSQPKAPPPAEGEEEADEETGGGLPEGSVQVAPKEKGPKARGSATQHTVERGDTLWDLSQKYMGSPWYWPKVWSNNPDISNPHWIYPGNVVRFTASGEEAPAQVELGAAPEDVIPETQTGGAAEDDAVEVTGKVNFIPPSTVVYRVGGFVTQRDVEEAGHIAGSFSNAQFLSSNMQAYIEVKKSGLNIGDRFVIFKPAQKVYHPRTGDTVGYLTQLTGAAKVVRTDGPKVTVAITDAFDVIERGDLVAPYNDALLKRVAARANDKNLEGTIVAQLGIGTYVTVIVDQGADHGVQPGNVFTVVRQHDGVEFQASNYPAYRNEEFPEEDVGHCIAWEIKSKTTSCLVVNALRELVVGDRVKMRMGPAFGAHASR